MTYVFNSTLDEELDRYINAEEALAANVGSNLNNTKKVFNVASNSNEYYTELFGGGNVKLHEQPLTALEDAQMYNQSLLDQGITPTKDDFYAAGFDDAIINEGGFINVQPKSGITEPLTEDVQQQAFDLGFDVVSPEKQSLFEDGTSEIIKGLVRGGLVRPAQFLKENFDIYDPLVFQVVDPQTGEFDPAIKILSREEKAELEQKMAAGELPYAFDFEELVETNEEAGAGAQVMGTFAQFIGAYAGLGKLFRLGKNIFVGGMTQGAAADFMAFRGDEGRLSDILYELGVPENQIVNFLQTDPNDPDYVGRFKTALEGGVLGTVAEPILLGIGKAFRAVKDGDIAKEQVLPFIDMAKDNMRDTLSNVVKDVGERLKQPGQMPPLGSNLGNVGQQTQLATSNDLPGRISTRFPTAKQIDEDPMSGELIIGLEEMKKDTKLFDFNVSITKDYLNMRSVNEETIDETSERFIEHVKDNLLYLHDQVPDATRARSQKWYDGARAITDRWSQEYNVPDTSIAGVLAGLSPQKDWYQNVSLAERTLEVATKQKDFKFTKEMQKTFVNLPALNKPKYKPMLDAIKNKSYAEIVDENPAIQATLRAMFVRLYDQTYNKPDYKIVSPEGEFLEIATNADGTPSKAAWGSLNEISKAVASIDAAGDVNTISRLMGERHKVRNFYNNIYDPNSSFGDVTIDTHAVAAGLLRPLSGNSLEVDHNFKNQAIKGRGTTKGSAKTGVSGNYGLYAEAYRRAAAERGILPRQMQSITWEAVRGLFPDKFKASAKNVADIDAIWQKYKKGDIELDETRRLVNERANGVNAPSWE